MAIENLDDLDTTIADLIYTATGIRQIIESYQGKAPPEILFGTYRVTPVRAYGFPVIERNDIAVQEPVPEFGWRDYVETVVTSMEVMVSVNFFNDGADQAALMMQQSQFRQIVSEYCFQNDIAWRYTSETRDLSEMEMATIQKRYQVDLHLWVETRITDTMLRAAAFSVAIEDEDGHNLATVDNRIGI